MTEKEYEELNDDLNDLFIFLQKKDNFLIENINLISYYNDILLNELKKLDLFEKEKYRFIDNHKLGIIENKLTYQDVFNLVDEITSTIDPEFNKTFKYVIDNHLITLSYENEFKIGSHMLFENEHKEININWEFNYQDVISIIHELTHYYTFPVEFNEIEYLLTEYLAIYFELYATVYFYNLGIPNEELDYNYRLRNLLNSSYSLYKYEIPISIYHNFGIINEESRILTSKYRIKLDKETLDYECSELQKSINKSPVDFGKMIKSNYRYVLGSLLAYYTLDNCNCKDVFNLCKNINTELYRNMDLLEILETINIHIDNYKEFFNECINSINKYDDKKITNIKK